MEQILIRLRILFHLPPLGTKALEIEAAVWVQSLTEREIPASEWARLIDLACEVKTFSDRERVTSNYPPTFWQVVHVWALLRSGHRWHQLRHEWELLNHQTVVSAPDDWRATKQEGR
jgi:hypothetical protein